MVDRVKLTRHFTFQVSPDGFTGDDNINEILASE